ncbi:MAG: hypothetical protein RLZZ50_1289 [Verrucomicrobiota bacterium]
MPDFRVYLQPAARPAGRGENFAEITLPQAETHHLVNVNRARPGDAVVAFDGRGAEWLCRLERVEAKKNAVLSVESACARPPLTCALTLGQGLPKGGVMDEIVRQATELGAAAIVPLAAARSEVRLEADRAEKKIDKWRSTAIEAAKQCGNPFLPEISPVLAVDDFLALPQVRDAELRLVASLHPGARPLRTALADFRLTNGGRPPRSAAWLIGPEGDLTAEEVGAALSAGWIPVSLGPLVLRCDTAAAFALSVLRCDTEA